MKRKILMGLCLCFLLSLFSIPNVYATTYTWNAHPYLDYEFWDISEHRATDGVWDVMGFQWGDPDNQNASGFSYSWQDGIISIWVGDWEHDYIWPVPPVIEGTTVGTCRQGVASTEWYTPTYQPNPLKFGGKSAITLKSRVRIDYRDTTLWTNALFNPWFKVVSTYAGVTKVRLVVFDIIWGWSSWWGTAAARDWIDPNDESLHLSFLMNDTAGVGKWKTYTIDLLDMAERARRRAKTVNEYFPWSFEVEDLYLYSIEACFEGWEFNAQFSVDYLEVTYEYAEGGGGGGGGCPYVSVWDGQKYRLDNNLLPSSEYVGGDVVDYYELRRDLVRENGKYSFLISEFENEHSYLDQVQLLAVDHESDVNIAVSPNGEILTYKNPVPPVSAFNREGENLTGTLRGADSCFYEGYDGDYVTVNFGNLNISDGAKLLIRSDFGPRKSPIYIQTLNSTGDWNTVATTYVRRYWYMDIVDLSPYLASDGEELNVRLCFVSNDKIDFVGLDTSKNENFEIQYSNLASAVHSVDGKVKSALSNDDDVYAELVPDQWIELKFTPPQQILAQRSFIIVVKGHYVTEGS